MSRTPASSSTANTSTSLRTGTTPLVVFDLENIASYGWMQSVSNRKTFQSATSKSHIYAQMRDEEEIGVKDAMDVGIRN
jgi:hypothetical protein